MKIIQWEDIDCTVRINLDKITPTLEFEVFEIMGKYENKKTGKYTEPIYEKKGAKSSEDETENLDEAQTLIRGYIKWDACSHIYFGDEKGYIHLCGGSNWYVLQEAIKRIWEIAMKELPQEHSKDMFGLELFNKQEKETL